MGGHIKIHLEEFDFVIPTHLLSVDNRNDVVITLSFKSNRFKKYSSDDLFQANWVIKMNHFIVSFKIFQTTVNKDGNIMCKARRRDIIIMSDKFIDDTEDGGMKAFFCFPPCPTCMQFMKLYPECSKVIKGLIL